MSDKDVSALVKGKGTEIKEWFKDIDAKLEDWKFTIEETKEGMRVELHAKAFIQHRSKK